MAKITETIIPFVTPFKEPELLDLRDTAAHSIEIKSGVATIYEDNKASNTITVPIWGYNGQFLGPSLLMNRDQQIDITWINAVDESDTLPCPAVEVASHTAQNDLGIDAGATTTMGHGCHPRFTTHLHGGKIPPASDGWPESMMLPEQNSLKRYENKQRAALIWYHDHAMHTTRLNVYAGMAGAWLITDEEETALELPAGDKMLPIVIQDRNLSVSHDGSTNMCCCHKKTCGCTCNQLDANEIIPEGECKLFNSNKVRLLHKVGGLDQTGPMEFAGPLTLVNSRIWPTKKVEPSCYRLRILNGANSRTYGLVFAENKGSGADKANYTLLSKDEVKGAVRQIGTDGGLLKAPVGLSSKSLPSNGDSEDTVSDHYVLILSPAERADILVDFSKFEGKNILLLNCAVSPFGNEFINPLNSGDIPEEKLLTYPEVMQFTVEKGAAKASNKAGDKSYSFDALNHRFENLAILTGKEKTSYAHDADLLDSGSKSPKVRTIGIVEKTVDGKAMLVLWEMLKAEELTDSLNDPVLRSTKSILLKNDPGNNGVDTTYYIAAERFQDPVSYMVEYGSTERWRFINLTADTHPMHMHLVQFLPYSRKKLHIDKSNDPWSVNIEEESSLDENEKGFKDTIRVNPGEMVEVKAHFDGYMGRYVYHCHLLEHEDHDMMRQFVVTRDDLHMPMQPVISVGE